MAEPCKMHTDTQADQTGSTVIKTAVCCLSTKRSARYSHYNPYYGFHTMDFILWIPKHDPVWSMVLSNRTKFEGSIDGIHGSQIFLQFQCFCCGSAWWSSSGHQTVLLGTPLCLSSSDPESGSLLHVFFWFSLWILPHRIGRNSFKIPIKG